MQLDDAKGYREISARMIYLFWHLLKFIQEHSGIKSQIAHYCAAGNFLQIELERLRIRRDLAYIQQLFLTLSQTTNFRVFQTERVCRRQFQI